MTDEQHEEKTGGITTASLDKVLTRGGGGIGIVALLWMGNLMSEMQRTVSDMRSDIVKVTTELSVVAPKDVQQAVNELRAEAVTKEDVRAIVDQSAPWHRDRMTVMDSIRRIEQRLDRLEDKTVTK